MTEKPNTTRGVESLERVLSLYDALLHDLGAHPKTIETIMRRGRSEGLTFFTQRLPDFGNKFFLFLETNAPCFTGWKCFDNGLPVLLSEFVSFDLLSNPTSPEAIHSCKAIRQICFFVYKAEDGSDIDSLTVSRAVDQYKSLEGTLPVEMPWDPILATCAYLAEETFRGFNWDELRGSNGPGTVADCKSFHMKFEGNLEPSFSSDVNYMHYSNEDHFVSDLGAKHAAYDNLTYGQAYQVSEFLCVPKDSRGPRTICREPAAAQFAQQALRKFMESKIVRASSVNSESRVNFSDQSVNGLLALNSSVDRKYATLDLKDASDRISYVLVEKIFSRCGDLWRLMKSTRSTHVVFPDGESGSIRKFAPMGSAICFTTLSFSIWALLTCSFRLIGRADLADEVYVYGDDLVVPVECYTHSIAILQTYGLKVNVAKSYAHSYFRESCGVDAYAGKDITPVRLRYFPLTHLCEGVEIASLADTVHQLWRKGLFLTAAALATFLPELPPGESDEGYCNLPEELLGATKRSYWSFRGKKVSLDGVGRPFVRAKVMKIAVAERTGVRESDLDFFYRVLYPRIGGDAVDKPQKGVIKLPRQTRVSFQKLKIYV